MPQDAFSGPHLFGAIDPQAVSDMAWMSDVAYTVQSRPLAELLAERGWQPLGAGDLDLPAASFDRLGYYSQQDSQGFVAVKGGTLAVVFRGSDEPSDLAKLAKSVFEQEAIQDVRPMVHQALAWVEAHPEIGTVYITGQSLGGALAGDFASSIEGLPRLSRPVQFQVVAFGSPGSEQDDRNDLTRSMLEVNHTGDPVPTDDLLGSRLEHHGSVAAIDLPLVPSTSSLVELGMQKQDDPPMLTEHDSEIYRESTAVIAASPLYAYTTQGISTAILGFSSDDSYSVPGAGAFTLGGGGNDTIYGSTGSDLLDGGAGDDSLFGEPGEVLLASAGGDPMSSGGDDALAGGIGNDLLFGGAGRDVFTFASAAGGSTDRVGDFIPGIDQLDVRAFSFTAFEAQLAPLIAPGAEGAVISLSAAGGEEVILAGLDATLLGPNDFIL
jgi:RTX calcium-binding nonapeptide repeat (4 copies)/Lipase (class 3)